MDSKTEIFECKNCGQVHEVPIEIAKDYVNWKCTNCYEIIHRKGFVGTKVIWKTDTGTVKRNEI